MEMYDKDTIMSLKQKKIKLKPRIKLNDNIYNSFDCRRSCCNHMSRICHFRKGKRTGAEMRPEIVSGIATWDKPVSYWPNFLPCP